MRELRRVAGFRLKQRLPYDFEKTVRKPAGWNWFTPFEVWRGYVMTYVLNDLPYLEKKFGIKAA